MFQLITEYGGYGLFAQIALALFFIAFLLILFSTLIRPKSQMQHYARMALTDDINPGPGDDPATQANPEHGAAHHE